MQEDRGALGVGLLSAFLFDSLSRALGARKGLADEVLNAQARHLSMTKNSFGVQFTKCPRCEDERKSLAQGQCRLSQTVFRQPEEQQDQLSLCEEPCLGTQEEPAVRVAWA